MSAAGTLMRTRPPRAARTSAVSVARLLRLELRRSPWPWMIPLLTALFLFDPFRTAMSYPPVWGIRASVIPNKMLPDFVAFVGGVSAWAGSRDGRRNTTDLLAATPWPSWARRGVTLAATMCWVLATYLVFVAVLYVAIGREATWGGPPWWPVAVGAAALAALCAVGFAAGAFFPGRFTAPLVAFGVFLVSIVAFKNAVGEVSGYALLSPSGVVPNADIGVFYPSLPDLPIAQVMFLGGVAVAGIGVLGVPGAAGGLLLRRAAAVITVAGLAAAVTGAGLGATSRLEAHGVVIPALHDAASDRPIPYTPVCGDAGGVPVCLHPAFRTFIPDTVAALGPALKEVAGLPGAPVRASQVASSAAAGSQADISGAPPVFHFSLNNTPGSFAVSMADFEDGLRVGLVTALVNGNGISGGAVRGDTRAVDAQLAVQAALLEVAGVPLSAQQGGQGFGGLQEPPADSAQISAAAQRFAALPAATRHAWLAAHLPALRAGQITLAQLP